MTYLYVTIVWHPVHGKLYYYGSKTVLASDELASDGTVAGYHGSAPLILKHPEWCQTRLFRWLVDESDKYTESESQLIIRGWLKHGAYYRGSYYTGSDGNRYRRSWLDVYDRGTCINCHCGHAEQLHTSEVHRRVAKTKIAKGTYYKGGNPSASHVACEAARQKRISEGSSVAQREHCLRHQKEITDKSHTAEALAKLSQSRKLLGKHCKLLLGDEIVAQGSYSCIEEYLKSVSIKCNAKAAFYIACELGSYCFTKKSKLYGFKFERC